MRNSLLRPLLVVEFLLAIQAVFTFWSEVGGQYHLDLMYWPWKFGFGLGAASLIVGITAALARNGGEFRGRVLLLASLLLTLMLAAGAVTYYYHLNEPPSEDDEDAPTSLTTYVYQTLQEAPPLTIGKPALQPKAFWNSGILDTVPLTR
jgi:hypothetical protein